MIVRADSQCGLRAMYALVTNLVIFIIFSDHTSTLARPVHLHLSHQLDPVLPLTSVSSFSAVSPSVSASVETPSTLPISSNQPPMSSSLISPSPTFTLSAATPGATISDQISPTIQPSPIAESSLEPTISTPSPSVSSTFPVSTHPATNTSPNPSGESAAQMSDTSDDKSSAVLPRPALIAVSIGGAVVVILAFALLLFFVQRRRMPHSDNSYYRFTDPNSCETTSGAQNRLFSDKGNTVAPSASDQAHTSAASGISGYDSQSHAGGTLAMATTNQSNHSDTSSLPPPAVGPSAPSASQFSRRESDVSSGSSDTIVAPIYANDSVQTSAAAPWFHDNRSDTPH